MVTNDMPREKPPNYLEIHASNHPDKPAVVGPDRMLTYGQLKKRARALAKSLYEMGVRPGDQVALMTYNDPVHTEVSAALSYLEVGLVMVGFRMKPREIEHIVNDSDSRVLIFMHEFADRILPFRKHYPKILADGFISFGEKKADGASDYGFLFDNVPDVDLDAIPPAAEPGSSMIYTSGTTGRPKGAARKTDFVSKPGVLDYIFTAISTLGMNADEVHLVCCPIYHSAPTLFNTISFLLGGTTVMQPRFDAVGFLELVDRYGVTSTHLVPTMVRRLLDVPESITRRLDLSSLRTVICGAAPLFPEYKLSFLDRYGDCLFEYYGSTESGMNTLITPSEMRKRPSSVGRAFANNDLIILDDTGKEMPDGARGVLYMYNEAMMDGYYKNVEATDQTRHGKHITVGDVAVRDSSGYYYIVDRVKDMIIRGGVNIYPAEVEEVLASMPGIADTAVVGMQDYDFGEAVAAFIVFEDEASLSKEDITAYCSHHMENHKIPAAIIPIREIPRTPTGKILKRNLREMLQNGLDPANQANIT
ncbi:MAG: AMP-binding protein [Desulfobacterales bacterium]